MNRKERCSKTWFYAGWYRRWERAILEGDSKTINRTLIRSLNALDKCTSVEVSAVEAYRNSNRRIS